MGWFVLFARSGRYRSHRCNTEQKDIESYLILKLIRAQPGDLRVRVARQGWDVEDEKIIDLSRAVIFFVVTCRPSISTFFGVSFSIICTKKNAIHLFVFFLCTRGEKKVCTSRIPGYTRTHKIFFLSSARPPRAQMIRRVQKVLPKTSPSPHRIGRPFLKAFQVHSFRSGQNFLHTKFSPFQFSDSMGGGGFGGQNFLHTTVAC